MNSLAYSALVVLQLAPLTMLYTAITEKVTYPIGSLVLFSTALAMLTIHSIINKERIYIFWNISGLVINISLLILQHIAILIYLIL